MSEAVEFGGALKTIEFDDIEYDARHGGPFDRGSADSHYGRGMNPHYYLRDTYQSPRINITNKDSAEYEAYVAGYEFNEQFGDKKDFG
jgi:hypothetical protein